MPSVMSLASQQYYGNPRNAFWRITGDIFGFAADDPYDDRTAALRRATASRCGMCCGRADEPAAWIRRSSRTAWWPTTSARFFDAYPAIDRVFFNGAAAEKNFVRLAGSHRPLRYRRLPSTSPAQTMRYADKLAAWRERIPARTPAAYGRAHGRTFSICAPATAASPRRTACPPAGSMSVVRCRRGPTARPRRAGRSR